MTDIETFKRVDYGTCYLPAHKGKKWKDVPKDYLEYIIKPDCNTGSENKITAEKELKQRRILSGQIEIKDFKADRFKKEVLTDKQKKQFDNFGGNIK